MSRREINEILEDMIDCIERITAYVKNMSYDEFMTDLKTQDAVIRNIEIIGEAAKQLPNSFKTTHSDIPWRAIAGTRDRLIHDYSGVNYDIVWVVIVNDLPSLQPRLIEIFESDENLEEKISLIKCVACSSSRADLEALDPRSPLERGGPLAVGRVLLRSAVRCSLWVFGKSTYANLFLTRH